MFFVIFFILFLAAIAARSLQRFEIERDLQITMDRASGNTTSPTNQQNKRVRFDPNAGDDTSNTAGTPTSAATPTATGKADETPTKFTETLHPELSTFFNKIGC